MFLLIVHNSFFFFSYWFVSIMFQGYKKQVKSASQSSLKNTGEQRGIKRSIRLCPAPLYIKHQQLGILGDYLGLLGA